MAASLIATTFVMVMTSTKYEFVPSTDGFANGFVGVIYGDNRYVGKLDPSGAFWAIYLYDPDAVSGVLHTVLNPEQLKNKDVYEFRNKILVLGRLRDDGHFLPTPGPQQIPISQYNPWTSPPIWNLPGYFKPVLVAKNPPGKN